MPNLTDKEIIALFKKHHPKTAEDVRALGIEAEYVRSGCARRAFQVSDNLICKIEIKKEEGQSAKEIEMIEKINKDAAYKSLRKHTAKIYYANKETGTILMKFYPHESPYLDYPERQRLQKEFKDMLGLIDLHAGNFRKDKKGIHVVIDLGWNYV